MTLNIPLLLTHPDFFLVAKPAGLTVQRDEQQPGVLQRLSEQLHQAPLWPVHRLDKHTSGILIVARNAEAASRFGELFSRHQVDKYYLAITAKRPNKKQGTVIGDMRKARNKQWMLCKSTENPAISQFFSQGYEKGKRLVLIRPYSGKTHQIRVMLKSLGAPILGDEIYGGASADRLYLHGYGIKFDYLGDTFSLCHLPQDGEFFTSLDKQKLGGFTQPQLLSWPALPRHLTKPER